MMSKKTGKGYNNGLLICLFFIGIILVGRLFYFYLEDVRRFPVNTVKISANYHHISHKTIESVLSNYLNTSFFFYQFQNYKKL